MNMSTAELRRMVKDKHPKAVCVQHRGLWVVYARPGSGPLAGRATVRDAWMAAVVKTLRVR